MEQRYTIKFHKKKVKVGSIRFFSATQYEKTDTRTVCKSAYFSSQLTIAISSNTIIFNDHQEKFLNSPIPKCETVYHIVKHFEKIRSGEDNKSAGHPCLVHTEEDMQRVAQAFTVTPTQSA